MQTVGIWGLREEARNSWDHIVSDKVVYLAESGQWNLEIGMFTKQDIDGNLWVDARLARLRGLMSAGDHDRN
jgi:hypothetical protein